jgi:hypothetical protein
VLVVVAVAALLAVLGRNPVAWVRETWYDVRGTTVAVAGVSAEARPPGSVAPGYDAAFVVDGAEDDAWATAWPAATPTPTECGVARGIGRVVLRLPEPTRVRGIRILAGLPVDDADRSRQFRPRRVDVGFEGGCAEVSVDDTAEQQTEEVDTGQPVTRVTLTIASAYPPARPDGAQELVAISMVTLLTRPE